MSRLIDADAFKKAIGTDTKIRKMLCMAIDEQPTAYNGGWIPVSEQEEPNENGQYIVRVQHYLDHDLYDISIIDWRGEWKKAYEWNVIAWMPIPEYQPKKDSV